MGVVCRCISNVQTTTALSELTQTHVRGARSPASSSERRPSSHDVTVTSSNRHLIVRTQKFGQRLQLFSGERLWSVVLDTVVYDSRPNSSTMFISTTISSQEVDYTSGSPPASARNSATWELLLQSVLLPALCVVGIVGNSLSIFVLTRQRMRRSAQLPERAVHVGLVGLAVSDMAVCLLTLPRAFVPEYQLMFDADSETLAFYYQVTGPTWRVLLSSVPATSHAIHCVTTVDTEGPQLGNIPM